MSTVMWQAAFLRWSGSNFYQMAHSNLNFSHVRTWLNLWLKHNWLFMDVIQFSHVTWYSTSSIARFTRFCYSERGLRSLTHMGMVMQVLRENYNIAIGCLCCVQPVLLPTYLPIPTFVPTVYLPTQSLIELATYLCSRYEIHYGKGMMVGNACHRGNLNKRVSLN